MHCIQSAEDPSDHRRCQAQIGNRRQPWCALCAGNLRTTEYKCSVVDRKAATGRMCLHVIPKCKQEDTQPSPSPARPRRQQGRRPEDNTPSRRPNKRRYRTPHRPCRNVGAPTHCANGKQVVEAALQTGKEMEAEIMILQEPRKIGSKDSRASHPGYGFIRGGSGNIEGVDSKGSNQQEINHLQNGHNRGRGGLHPGPQHHGRELVGGSIQIVNVCDRSPREEVHGQPSRPIGTPSWPHPGSS